MCGGQVEGGPTFVSAATGEKGRIWGVNLTPTAKLVAEKSYRRGKSELNERKRGH
jgi:hypothetical protein